ncbi:MAG: hypothetical protein MZW92_40090 [Comamonadaceae bacterium]|nr:hypothetical protein [Comamonadaceae bacterium]
MDLGAGGPVRAARAGLDGAVEIARRRSSRSTTLFLIVRRAAGAGGAVAGCSTRTRWGIAGARRDAGPRDGRRAGRRPGAGCSPRVFALGALLAGLAGALQIPREPVERCSMDLAVDRRGVRGRGRRRPGLDPGAFLAAL